MGTADKNDQKRYYVYLFRHPDDGRPVYVGKGTGERAKSHRTDSPNVFLFDLLKEFPEIEPEFVQVDLTESEAFALEKCLIAQYGRQIDGSGTLFNVLEGGADEYGRGQNLEFEGVNYSSLKALCLARGVDYHKVYLRINRYGLSLEDALTKETHEFKRPSLGTAQPVTFRGHKYQSQRQLAERFGVDFRRLHARLRSGWSLEEALGLKKRKYENLGGHGKAIVCDRMTFPSVSAFARHYGVDRTKVSERFRLGWTPEEAVDLKNRRYAGKGAVAVEAFGDRFISIAALARDPRCIVSEDVLRNRLSRGVDPETASTAQRIRRSHRLKTNVKGWKQYEFQGKTYRSLSALCREFGVSRDIFRRRYNVKGWSMAEALGVEKRSIKRITKPTTVSGVDYPSQRAAAEAHGVSEYTFSQRLLRGLTPEHAAGLVPIASKYKAKEITIQGIKYPSRMQAAAHFGVKYPTMVRRLNADWSPEQAVGLEPPPKLMGKIRQ